MFWGYRLRKPRFHLKNNRKMKTRWMYVTFAVSLLVWGVSLMFGGKCRHGYLEYITAQRNIQYDRDEAKKDRSQFWIIPNFIISENRKNYGNFRSDRTLTLVTQTSIEHIHGLEMLSNRWTGPISVAVLIYSGQLDYGLRTILSLYHEFPKIKAKTTFHLVIYKNGPSKKSEYSLSYQRGSLYDTTFLNGNLQADIPYPGNVLRNVALSSVQNGFILMIDIDLVPSTGLHDQFLHYTRRKSKEWMNKTAFVVPSFEALNDSFLANNKSQLLTMQKDGYIQPFGSLACRSCQVHTDYKVWSAIQNKGFSSYLIKRLNKKYEPFYILQKEVYPEFDERFKGRHRDRVSQVHEVHLSGIQFAVLTNAFLLHRGFRPKRYDYVPNNERLFQKFERELIETYNKN